MARRSLLPLVFLLLPIAGDSFATDYYVSSQTGNDASSGLSPDVPWQSITRVNRAKFQPGDHILLHSGDLWREQLRPPSSGTQERPIVFSSYGPGERPILEGMHGFEAAKGALRRSQDPTRAGDVAIDNNDQSHMLYDGLELRDVVEGLRVYVWSGAVRDITLRNCQIQVDAAVPNGPPSAAVYANVRTGSIADFRVLANRLIPFPRGLERWGIYFAGGVQHFQIIGNKLGPAGEDGIAVWHSAYGEINRNQGGGNGENTIDVKDSHNIVISNNVADLDREYNIVVHSVDSRDSTYGVRVAGNHCSRGGQGGRAFSRNRAAVRAEIWSREQCRENCVWFGHPNQRRWSTPRKLGYIQPPDWQRSRTKASGNCAPRHLHSSRRRERHFLPFQPPEVGFASCPCAGA